MKKYLFIDTWNGEGYSDSRAFIEEHSSDQKAKERVLDLSKEYMGNKGESKIYVCPHAPSLVSISYTTACSIDDDGEWVDAGMVSVEDLKEDFVGVTLAPDTNSYHLFDTKEGWEHQVINLIKEQSDEVEMGEDVIGNCHHEIDGITIIPFDIDYLDLTDEDLLADFINLKDTGMSVYSRKEYKFKVDWNWLMLVIKKIKALNIVDTTATDRIDFYLCGVNIEGTYESAVEFVKWYNEDK